MRATDIRFLELLRHYMGPFLVDSEEREREVMFSVDGGVERVMPGGKMVRALSTLYLGTLKLFHGPVREQVAGRLVSGVRDMATLDANEFVRIRAGAVAIDGEALILPSPPQPHLAALVALLVRAGARFLGDEIVNLDPVLQRVHGVSFPLLVAAPDLAVLPELKRDPGRDGRGHTMREVDSKTPRYPVTLAELGGEASGPASLTRIIFPYFEPGAPTELVSIGRSEALFRFTEAVLNLHVWTDRVFVLAQRLMATTSVARLNVGSLPEGADLLMKSLAAPVRSP